MDYFDFRIRCQRLEISILSYVDVQVANSTSDSSSEIFNGDDIIFRKQTLAR